MDQIIEDGIIQANKQHIPLILAAMQTLTIEFPHAFFVPSTKTELEQVLISNVGLDRTTCV